MAESYKNDENVFYINYGLKDLLGRLSTGMTLRGRIVEVLGNNRYIIRIWGYNLLTESSKTFRKNDVVEFDVRQLKPRLVLDFSHARNYDGIHSQQHTDFFV